MANFVNTNKNVSTISNIQNSHGLYYILTDTSDYVLVGSGEDEFLIWDDFITSYKNLTKN